MVFQRCPVCGFVTPDEAAFNEHKHVDRRWDAVPSRGQGFWTSNKVAGTLVAILAIMVLHGWLGTREQSCYDETTLSATYCGMVWWGLPVFGVPVAAVGFAVGVVLMRLLTRLAATSDHSWIG